MLFPSTCSRLRGMASHLLSHDVGSPCGSWVALQLVADASARTRGVREERQKVWQSLCLASHLDRDGSAAALDIDDPRRHRVCFGKLTIFCHRHVPPPASHRDSCKGDLAATAYHAYIRMRYLLVAKVSCHLCLRIQSTASSVSRKAPAVDVLACLSAGGIDDLPLIRCESD